MRKKILIFFIFMLLFTSNIYSLKLLEPLTSDLNIRNKVDLGYFSADEFFMVSFLLEGNEDYHTISVSQEQIKDVIIEPTRHTKESIFTIIKLSEDLNGEYDLKLILKSDTSEKEVILSMYITDEVIHTNLLNYNHKVRFEEKEEITLNIINKSNTTKRVTITSDLPKTWFETRNEKIDFEKIIILPPNSITQTTYDYFPKEIGYKEFNLKIYPGDVKEDSHFINYNLNVDVLKDLSAIYGSREHTFPLFNLNMLPIYFFNKILRII